MVKVVDFYFSCTDIVLFRSAFLILWYTDWYISRIFPQKASILFVLTLPLPPSPNGPEEEEDSPRSLPLPSPKTPLLPPWPMPNSVDSLERLKEDCLPCF